MPQTLRRRFIAAVFLVLTASGALQTCLVANAAALEGAAPDAPAHAHWGGEG
jgi:hypothetical protein